MKRLVFAVVFALGVTGTATSQGTFMLYGPTGMSCGSFTAFSPDDLRRHELEWWLLGFVSGAGWEMIDARGPMARTDTRGLIGAVAKYCADHPLENYSQAAIVVVNQLRPQ